MTGNEQEKGFLEAIDKVNEIHAEGNRRKIISRKCEIIPSEPYEIKCGACEKMQEVQNTYDYFKCSHCGAENDGDAGLVLTKEQKKILKDHASKT